MRDVTTPSLEWNQKLVANMANRPADAPPPLGLNLLMGANTGVKVKNMMIENIGIYSCFAVRIAGFISNQIPQNAYDANERVHFFIVEVNS